MVVISEWLPNPRGSDTRAEWIELHNNGPAPVNLAGWYLRTKNPKQKPAALSGILQPDQYLLLPRFQTKLSLRNKDEGVLLYDPFGKLVDQSAFTISAPEAKSYSRTPTGQFLFSEATPAAANKIVPVAMVTTTPYTPGVALQPPTASITICALTLATALTVTAAMLLLVQYSNDLSQLFFPPDQADRSEAGG